MKAAKLHAVAKSRPLLPSRPLRFRIITVASSGLGAFALSLWMLENVLANDMAAIGAPAAALLGALAATTTALAFFAGVDESADYVFAETHFDRLTGLFNRPATIGRIADAACRTAETGKPVFLIDLDIDRFKQINDAIGYEAGDELIREFAKRLVSLLPRRAEVGRIGAGEFAVLISDRPDFALETLADMLLVELMRPYTLSNHQQTVNVSAGIVALPKDGSDPVLLLRRSNLALQNARSGGIGAWTVFRPEMGRAADRRQWIESELHAAFDRGEFSLHYQPQLDLGSSRVVGYEALVRWQHPERGAVSPAEFIPIAEETGMIVPLGAWVLETACADARALPEDCAVAVNISPIQFLSRDFLATVRGALSRSGIVPSRLELEVTETAMTQDRVRAAEILEELASLGISVAVDDFGTGYSNLSSLVDFPFRKIKIDRSFVHRMEDDASSGAVVSTIVGLSRALGVRIIAEGVETAEQATLLRAAGCETVQGYLYGKPEPLESGSEPKRAATGS